VQRVEAALRTEPHSIYIVYYNPTAAHCFDASSLFDRTLRAPDSLRRRGTWLWAR
jgi:hypothetical protein